MSGRETMNGKHHLGALAALATLLTAAGVSASEPTTHLSNDGQPASPSGVAPAKAAETMATAPPPPPDEVTELDEEDDSIADFRVDLGGGAQGSSWRGDFGATTNLRIGVRFIDLIAPYAQLGVGYHLVDDRMLTTIALGAQIWAPENWPLRLYGRVAALHQHEEAVSVIAGDFGKALFGVGDGIRHRPGVELGGGVDVPFWEEGDFEIYGLLDGSAKIFPDQLGPLVYGGGGLNVGMSYAL
jgi:hypothetical protein